MKYASIAFAITISAIAIDSGVPRLIGYGCGNPPSIAGFTYHGPRLAREESDFPQCERIEQIL
jgi:hypothetical protein